MAQRRSRSNGVSAPMVRMQMTLDQIVHDVQDMKALISGHDGSVGLMLRVDRLEQSESTARRHWGVLYTAIVTLFVTGAGKILYDSLGHHV